MYNDLFIMFDSGSGPAAAPLGKAPEEGITRLPCLPVLADQAANRLA